MSRWNTLKKILTDRDYRTIRLAKAGFYNHLDDKAYLQKLYRAKMGQPLNLDNPQLFSEKLQWLKLNDRNPLYTQLVDKYRAREYIAEKLGEEYLIPLLGVWDDPEDIDFDALPDQFVLKCNHNSGTGMCICRDKSKLDYEAVRRELRKGLQENFFLKAREWPYKDVPRKIICEQYMTDGSGKEELTDYKFFCFHGQVKCFKVDFDRFLDHRANWYDRNRHLIPCGEISCPPCYEKQISFPENLQQMIDAAETLSSGIPFVRVDLYSANEKIYFGELTIFPACGWGRFTDDQWDCVMGQWLHILAGKADGSL